MAGRRCLLREQISDGDLRSRGRQRGDAFVGAEGDRASVAPAEGCRAIRHGLAVDLDAPIRKIDYPVVRDTRPGIETALVLAVETEA